MKRLNRFEIPCKDFKITHWELFLKLGHITENCDILTPFSN